MQLPPESILLLCIVLGLFIRVAIIAVAAPIRFRNKNGHTVESGFKPCDDKSLEPDVDEMVAVLEELGFVDLGCWKHSGFARVTARIIVLEHPQSLDCAKVMVTKAGKLRHFMVLFQTRFEDGSEIVTANNPISSG